MDSRPIGVFDSGLGGLTAVKALRQILPGERLIYFGDTARVPYGGRSRETLLKYARQDVRFLRTFRPKAIVIACNTADTAAGARMQREYDLTYLFISHALSVVRHISDRVMVMYLGRMVEFGNTDELFESPLHPYTQALLSAAPQPDPDVKINRVVLEGEVPNPANPPTGCHFHPRCRYCTEQCRKKAPPMTEVNGRQVACWKYVKTE